MKILLSTLFFALFMTACSHKVSKESYQYPNYKIIKPKAIYAAKRKNIQKLLNQYLGKPYIWAEEGPDAFDCSGLTYNIYNSMGVCIPRTASEQAKMGKTIAFKDLYYGDLIFFGARNKYSRRINHVGIYLSDGWFAQASSKKRRVMLTNLSQEPQYLKRLKFAKRYMSKNECSLYLHCSHPLQKMEVTDKHHTSSWKKGMHIPRRAIP